MKPISSSRRPHAFWRSIAVLCGAAALALIGCAAESPANTGTESAAEAPATDAEAAPAPDTGLTADEIISTIEPQGFECTVGDHPFEDRDEVVTCKGDDYVIITATSLVDESTMQDQIASAKSSLCKNQDMLGVDTMRSAVSGKWILVPGGDDEKNLAAFNTAMQNFGLEMTEDPC